MSVLLTAGKKALQKPRSAKPKKKKRAAVIAQQASYAMNPGGPIGGPLPDVPPFSTDKTAVFFFEDYVEGYEVILMITRKEIKSTQDTKSASKYQAAANHNHEKVEVWSSVGCVTFEDHHFQPIECPGFQEVGNGESILKFKVFMPDSDNDAIDCMITRHLNTRNSKLKYRHILDWGGRTYIEHTEENLTKTIPPPTNGTVASDVPPAAAFYSDPPPVYSVNDPFETKKKL